MEQPFPSRDAQQESNQPVGKPAADDEQVLVAEQIDDAGHVLRQHHDGKLERILLRHDVARDRGYASEQMKDDGLRVGLRLVELGKRCLGIEGVDSGRRAARFGNRIGQQRIERRGHIETKRFDRGELAESLGYGQRPAVIERTIERRVDATPFAAVQQELRRDGTERVSLFGGFGDRCLQPPREVGGKFGIERIARRRWHP